MDVNDRTVCSVERTAGVAGHVVYSVLIRSSSGESWQYEFNGNVFGGPVAMASTAPDGQVTRTVIAESRDFGEFASSGWVHHYFCRERRLAS